MQIQDFSNQHLQANKTSIQDLRSNIFEVATASLIFVLPVIVLFLLSMN